MKRSRLVAAAVVAGIASVTVEARALERWVLEPGQEHVVEEVFGGDLPSCTLTSASIARDHIDARYACASGPARVELVHPSTTTSPARRTASFALVTEAGSEAPPALLDAIATRLAAHEGALHWTPAERALSHRVEDLALDRRALGRVWIGAVLAATALVALVGAAVFAAIGIARRAGAIAAKLPSFTPPRWSSRLSAPVRFALVAAIAFAFLLVRVAPPPVHPDTTRDLLMAADCVAGRGCDRGPPTTLGLLVQGALWLRTLAAFRSFGLGVQAIRIFTLLLHALGVAVVDRTVSRRFSPVLAPWAAAFACVGGAWLVEAPLLWNPSISMLPASLFYACVLALTAGGGELAAAGAAFSMALAIDSHIFFGVLVPAFAFAIAASGKRPARAVIVAASVLVVTLLLVSRDAWIVNARALAGAHLAAPVALVIAASLGAGILVRRRFLALPPEARAAVVVAVATAFTLLSAAALWRVLGPGGGRRYASPAVFGLALGCGSICVALALALRRAVATTVERSTITIAGVVAAASLAVPLGVPATWSEADVESVARRLYSERSTFADLAAHLEGARFEVLSAFAAFEPSSPRPASTSSADLLLLKLPNATTSNVFETISLRSGTAILARIDPWLDRAKIRVCFAPAAGGDSTCVDTGVRAAGPASEASSIEERAYPALPGLVEAFPPEARRVAGDVYERITIDRAAPRGGAAHVLLLIGDDWIIEGADGDASARAPSKRLVLRADGSRGTVTFGRRLPATRAAPDLYWLPPVVEIEEGSAFQAAFEAAR